MTPTAKECLQSLGTLDSYRLQTDIEAAMIAFAIIHVEAALKAAALGTDIEQAIEGPYIDYGTIYNAYPLSNIK